nr:MAG TPA: AgrD [Caudoviricetes sp.]
MKSEAYTGTLYQSLQPKSLKKLRKTQTRRISGLGTPGKR